MRSVDWLSEVPPSWSTSSIGHEAWVRARLGWKGLTASEYVDEGIPMLATPNIKNAELDFAGANRITPERYDESPEIMLAPGDVLLTKDGSTIGTVNVVRRLPEPATVNGSIAVITPGPALNGRFLYWMIASHYMQSVFKQVSDGMGVPHLFQRDINRIKLPLPPTHEQELIADYLDRETAQIDTLIAKQEQLITTLRERRIAVISRGALSGFNPLSDSRGSGPSLGTVFSVTLGKMLDAKKEPKPVDVSLPYIRAANLQDDGLDLRDVNHMWYSPTETSRLDIRANDLLVVEGGAVGTAVLIKEPMPGWSFQKTVNRVRATSGWSTAWLSYVIRAYRDGGVIDLICDGSTIAHLTAEKLRALRIPAKAPSEQAEAVDSLDIATARIDTLITKAERFIELSKERRAALITAAVTGQLEIPA